jgi:hypothetical protein
MQIRLTDVPSIENDLLPVGDVPLAPIGLTGKSEAQLARAMAERVLSRRDVSEAEALAPVQAAFSEFPLAYRLGALAALMRRR